MIRSVKAALMATTVALTACGALPQSIELTEDQNTLRSEPITTTIQETPPFMFTTPSKALVDANVAVWVDPEHAPSWQRVLEENRIPDFTETLRDKFVDMAGDKYGFSFSIADAIEPTEDSADYSRLTTQYSSPYILELRTKAGMFGHGPLSWQTMFLNYFADATLIRQSDGKPVWRATCQVRDSESDLLSIPSSDVFDGTGEEFRASADYATTSCATQLVEALVKANG